MRFVLFNFGLLSVAGMVATPVAYRWLLFHGPDWLVKPVPPVQGPQTLAGVATLVFILWLFAAVASFIAAFIPGDK